MFTTSVKLPGDKWAGGFMAAYAELLMVPVFQGQYVYYHSNGDFMMRIE